MLEQKRAEAAVILQKTCGLNETQRFFCCCTTRQSFPPMRKAVVTSSQLTASLSRRHKGPESSWWSQAFRKGGCCVRLFVFCEHFVFLLVCLWELNLPFFLFFMAFAQYS